MTIQDRLEAQKDYVIQSYKEGKSMTKLGKEFGCNSGTIHHFLKKKKVETRKKQKYYTGDVSQFDDQIKQMYAEGASCGAISRKLGPSIHTICRQMNKLGLDTSRYDDVNRGDLLVDKLDQVIELFEQGISCRQIAMKLGHSDASVYELLIKKGYEPTKKIYEVDESFFEIIDTPEKSYTLGFLYGDGNVRDNCFRWQLQETDRDILEKISQVIKYNGPISWREREGNRIPQVSLYIGRKKMADDLKKLGCIPNKSLVLKFPTEDIVPQYLLSHFFRGYIDADGHIETDRVCYTGSYDFTYGSVKYLPCEHTSILQRYVTKDNNTSAHSVNIYRKAEVIKMLNWIYKDSTIHMDRKYNKYIEFCTKHGFTPVDTLTKCR